MSNSDGQVRIEVISNFDEVAKSADKCEKQVNNFDVSGLEKSFVNLDKTLKVLSVQFADFSKPVKENDSALQTLKNTIKSQYAEIENLQKGYNDLTAKLNKLKKPVEENSTNFDNLGKSYNTALVAQEKLFYALHVNKSFKETSMAVNNAKERLRELAFQGNTTSKEFQNLKQYVTEANKKFQETDTILSKNGLSLATSQTDNLTKSVVKLIGGLSALKIAQSTYQYVIQSVDAFRQEERSILALNTALANTGVYSQQYSIQIQQLASEIQSYSNYGNEAVIKAQALGQSFAGNTPITKDLTKAVVDFAAATGKDLDTAFTLVGKSIGSNTNALGRYGIQLDDNMSAEEKEIAIAQQLGRVYEGQARNMADSNIQLKNSFNEVSKAIGSVFSPELQKIQNEFSKFTTRLADVIRKINTLKEAWYKLNIVISQNGVETYKKNNYSKFDIQQQEARVKKYQKALQDLHKTEQTVINNNNNNNNLNKNGSGGGTRSSAAAKQAKDDYEKLQAAVQAARREIELAALAHGTSSTQVQNAFVKYNQLNTQLSSINALFNVEKQKVNETKTQFQELNDKIAATKLQLQELYLSEGQSENFFAAKNQLVELETTLQDMNTAISSRVGLDWTNVTNSIKSNLTSALLTPLQEGESAFERLGNTAFSIIQMIGQELTQKLLITPLIDNITNALQGVGNTAQPIQQVSQSLLNTGTAAAQTATATTAMATGQAVVSTTMATSSAAIAGAAAGYQQAAIAAQQLATSITQAAVSQAAYSVAQIPYVGGFLAPAAAAATGAAIAAANIMTTGTALLGKMGSLGGGKAQAFANGGVFNGGNVIPFAKGGVVTKPTVFPMANGGTGLMGEAGAEAVMPLRRMSNGRLGVEASGGGDGKAVQVNIYNQSNSQVETRRRDDGSMDIIIKRVNEALMNERTSSGFRAAYQREDRKGLQAV